MAGALVGALAGYGGGRISAPEPAAQPDVRALTPQPVVRPTERGETHEELALALVELSTTLDVLRKTLEQTPSAPSRTPVVEAMSRENTMDLASSLRVLANALQRPSSGKHSYAAETGLEIPAWVDRQSAFNTGALRQLQREGDEVSLDKEIDYRRNAYLFKTRQEILSRFGKPDRIEGQGSNLILWRYENEGVDHKDDLEDIQVVFRDDHVVDFYYEYTD